MDQPLVVKGSDLIEAPPSQPNSGRKSEAPRRYIPGTWTEGGEFGGVKGVCSLTLPSPTGQLQGPGSGLRYRHRAQPKKKLARGRWWRGGRMMMAMMISVEKERCVKTFSRGEKDPG